MRLNTHYYFDEETDKFIPSNNSNISNNSNKTSSSRSSSRSRSKSRSISRSPSVSTTSFKNLNKMNDSTTTTSTTDNNNDNNPTSTKDSRLNLNNLLSASAPTCVLYRNPTRFDIKPPEITDSNDDKTKATTELDKDKTDDKDIEVKEVKVSENDNLETRATTATAATSVTEEKGRG
ncbi:unnamed protein product [[Candida] boidinii]|nr:unnamed protein product [[Candida] boidinii]